MPQIRSLVCIKSPRQHKRPPSGSEHEQKHKPKNRDGINLEHGSYSVCGSSNTLFQIPFYEMIYKQTLFQIWKAFGARINLCRSLDGEASGSAYHLPIVAKCEKRARLLC
jgi:hypothetical protein